MAELYRYFAKPWEHVLDFSDEALVEMYNSESYGTKIDPKNGYLVGKHWLNVTVTMWKEDLALGTLFKHELYSDPDLPNWWLDGILKRV